MSSTSDSDRYHADAPSTVLSKAKRATGSSACLQRGTESLDSTLHILHTEGGIMPEHEHMQLITDLRHLGVDLEQKQAELGKPFAVRKEASQWENETMRLCARAKRVSLMYRNPPLVPLPVPLAPAGAGPESDDEDDPEEEDIDDEAVEEDLEAAATAEPATEPPRVPSPAALI
ncbi:hypothetical protein NM688_g4867 [Phlebia brevispora]|uniref:Uncharacterized protein n=1 Tax=Phlebia brevispora TaxID=194682 RepID=A0ACC1T1R3_9APHY|nr:hypothetical protein NM688_g4867 [Phlebia brevispora]